MGITEQMNTFKKIEQEQAALIVNKVAALKRFTPPKLGWIRTVRMALSMSGASLARRLGLQRSSLAYLQKAESDDSITLKKLKQVADAMNCELIYAIVPKATLNNPKPSMNDILQAQADKKALEIVKRASNQMQMEEQGLNEKALKKEVERLSKQLLDKMPKDFWG
jgi:predicted DNA-binding mobile mystery protein A